MTNLRSAREILAEAYEPGGFGGSDVRGGYFWRRDQATLRAIEQAQREALEAAELAADEAIHASDDFCPQRLEILTAIRSLIPEKSDGDPA